MSIRKTVLIVEDDPALRRLLSQALALHGYAVNEARGGFEALRLLESDPPNIVILDLAMPGVDGFAVRKELAAHAHTRDIPIVVVTGLRDDLEWLDVACVLRKPLTADDVIDAIRRCRGV